METFQKLEVLKEVWADEAELEQVVGKRLALTRSRHRNRVARQARDWHACEERYGMDSPPCDRRVEAGELGAAMDFLAWAGLSELRQDLLAKIRRVEATV